MCFLFLSSGSISWVQRHAGKNAQVSSTSNHHPGHGQRPVQHPAAHGVNPDYGAVNMDHDVRPTEYMDTPPGPLLQDAMMSTCTCTSDGRTEELQQSVERLDFPLGRKFPTPSPAIRKQAKESKLVDTRGAIRSLTTNFWPINWGQYEHQSRSRTPPPMRTKNEMALERCTTVRDHFTPPSV